MINPMLQENNFYNTGLNQPLLDENSNFLGGNKTVELERASNRRSLIAKFFGDKSST